MNPTRISTISRLFANRKRSRRQTLAAGAGFAAGSRAGAAIPTVAQDASPDASAIIPDAEHGPEMLFVQSFQSGSTVPNDAVDGRYTITLERGLGETIYFSDRPDRIVGSTPTGAFLDGLGFSDDNPPNAAILTDNPDGTSTIAVVELFAPVYDDATATLTYDVQVLDHWQDEADLGFSESPVDLDALGATFGTTHLFIDDCADWEIFCDTSLGRVGSILTADHDGFCYSWAGARCLPCQPWISDPRDAYLYWNDQCNVRFPDCGGQCIGGNVAL